MAVAHRGSAASGTSNPTTSFTITIPAATQSGDDCYVTVFSNGHLSGTAYPTVTDDDTGGNTWTRVGDSATNKKGTLWHKKATGSTASKTVTVAGCVTAGAGGIDVYSGGHAVTPTTNFTGTAQVAGVESVTGITPDAADSMICLAVCGLGDGGAPPPSPSSQACTNPGALTERWEHSSTAGGDAYASHASALQSGGPTATGNFTWAQNDSTSHTMIWAIQPAVAANNAPDTPTCTVDDFDHNSVDLSSSAFADDDVGDTHAASQWQVDESGGDFSTPVYDSGEDAVNLVTKTNAGPLSAGTAYIARVRHKDDSGAGASEWSTWSATDSFTTTSFPVATITSPSDGTRIPSGGAITFTGTGTDVEDGALTGASLEWESDLDGALGTGVSLLVTDLTDGVHDITLTAIDSDALEDTDTITVTVGGGGGSISALVGQSPFVRS
jgi:hypothetical protein